MTVVIKGAVSIKLQGLLKHKHLPGEWGVLYDAKGRHLPRIELYSEEDEASAVHVLELENLKFSDKSYQQQEPYFNLSIKKEKHHFQFDSVNEKKDWVQSLCHVSSELWMQGASAIHYADTRSREASSEGMNENFLYDSCDKVQQFKVSVCPTRASTMNSLQGNYILNPTQDSLHLLETDSFKSVHNWPYKQIRKYGRNRFNFKMEVGRKCSTGEGEFEFFTPDSITLVEWISVYMKQAREGLHKQGEENHGEARSSFTVQSYETQSSPKPLHHWTPDGFDGGRQDVPVPVPRSKLYPSTTSPTPSAENDTDSDASDFSIDKQDHSKDKKTSDKDRKNQEKAAAKLRKKQEREAKERMEKEKKQKNSKGKGKEAAPVEPESSIYDEPGDITAAASASCLHDPGPGRRQPVAPPSDLQVYSTPEEPQKDGWRKHARPEQDLVHTENYNSMKGACQSQPQSASPCTRDLPPVFTGEEDTYNHLGAVIKQVSGQGNIYGMVSAKETISSGRLPPVGARGVKDEYENAPDHFPKRPTRQVTPGGGDYAEVS